MEGLKERNVKATFFLLGAECEKYPEIVKKIHADGHLIGVHSYEHVNLSNLTDQAAMEQVDKTDQIIFGLNKSGCFCRAMYAIISLSIQRTDNDIIKFRNMTQVKMTI